MHQIYTSNNSIVYYKDQMICVNDYYLYIIEIIKKILDTNDNLNINIMVGFKDIEINNSNKCLFININYEHIIVKEGGRSVPFNCPQVLLNNTLYNVRIDNFNELNNSDIIIDYSKPNIKHVTDSGLFNNFINKCIYIAPSLCSSVNFVKKDRQISTLTTFININEPRRQRLLENLNKRSIPHLNVNNCWGIDNLYNLYNNTKIVINIHQTDHHDTFEELRVLPCIQCGVITICEESPFKEIIPYNNYIIWASYDKILDKVEEVLNNYDDYYNKIFIEQNNDIFTELRETNYNTLLNAIKNNLAI
jgi:hypothetical protein